MIREGDPRTFDSRVVLFHEVALDKPNSQSGLAHTYPTESELCPRKHVSGESGERGTLTTATDENELVFA